MSQRRGDGPGRPYQPRDDQERHQYQRCMELGLQYPPDPGQVYTFIQTIKKDGEYTLKYGNLAGALSLYNITIKSLEIFPNLPHFAEEHHKLLCNRSLVFLRMKQFNEAERDAKDAIAFCPSFIKGYWRASQAAKEGYNGVQRALPYLVEGLRLALRGEENSHDIVTFLTEVCILVPRAPCTDAMEKLLMDQLELPDSVNRHDIWNQVIQKLASQNNWKNLAMLLTGYNEGVSCVLEDQDTATWNWSSVNVGSLLSFLSDDALIKWGENLAVKLIKLGSDFEQIGKRFGCPSLHHVVRLALRLGSMKLLRYILEQFQRIPDMINSVDQDGSTALHIVVRSDIEPVINKLRVLDLLLENKCNAAVIDRFNKKPIDYTHQNDSLYEKLLKASKSVDKLRNDLEALKSQGNSALKAEKYSEALCKYDEALAISQQSKQLYKEAAVLYSNRANVFFTLQNYTNALADAIAAISCDSCWHKGHWWKAKSLLTIGCSDDAFGAYLDGYNQSEASGDVKLSFIKEAVTQLKYVTSENFMTCYNQLRFLNRGIWPAVLSKLSKNVEWKCMAYLILGTNLDGQRFGEKVDRTSMDFLCTGVAGSCDTLELQTNTIFQYLRKTDCDPKLDGPWLDAVLFAVYIHGHTETIKCLAMDDNDCPLHAAIRFAFQTGRESLVEELASSGKQFPEKMAVNPVGDSVFHFITKFRPPPENEILTKIMDILLGKGISVNVKDARGKLPVDYLDKNYPRSVFDMFFTPSTIDDINRLKEEGNILFKNGAVTDAVDMYSKAIDIFRSSEAKTVQAKLTKHEIAVLFGNRAEAYLKLHQYQPALDDAMQSVTFDCKWYKAHLRVGKAMRGLQRMEVAMTAFINAYCSIDNNVEYKVKVNILAELASVCSEMPKSVWNVKRMILGLPNDQGHLWAGACYELASNNNWNKAAIAYYQFSYSVSKIQHLTWTLKPFCDLHMLKQHPWGLEMMHYFLNCGCNRKTISLEHGDTYLHAVIRISLVVGNISLLQYLVQQYCRQGDTDQHKLDIDNNSALHAATKEKDVDMKQRYDVIVLLLKCNVNPNLKNASKRLPIDYLSMKETQNREVLRMAMYSKENISKSPSPQQANKNIHQTVSRSNATKSKESTSVMKPKRSCDICDCLYSQGLRHFRDKETQEGYEKMVELLKISHKGSHHEKICAKAVTEIVKRVAETQNPVLPPCLMSIRSGTFIMVVDGLANSNKWRQLDMLVRKFRQVHGSDQLKGFASNLSVVPVVRDTSLKASEEVKLQIVINLINSGASLGTDNGETAVKSAVSEEHFKVLTELVKRGADTSKLSMYDGDTPIHAAMVIVMEKEKSLVLLKFLLNQFETSPDAFSHLDPEQLDKNGDCLFHLLARAKFSTNVLKLTEMLCSKNLSANYKNKEGKLPINCITKANDRRLQYLRLASSVSPSREQLHGQNAPVKEGNTASLDEDLNQMQGPSSDSVTNQKVVIEVTRTVSTRYTRKRHIEELIRLLPDSKHSIFKVNQSPSSNLEDKSSQITEKNIYDRSIGLAKGIKEVKEDDTEQIKTKVREDTEAVEDSLKINKESVDNEDVLFDSKIHEEEYVVESDEKDGEEEIGDDYDIDAQVFDNLEWEVECTAEVWKTLRDKHVIPELKRRIIKKIQLLASGDWQPSLCKKLKNVPATLNLFEAKFSKGRRIIWELAVEFSPRCSETSERRLQATSGEITQPVRGGRIYSEIIRVWEIVLDHDKIHRCVQRIKNSHQKGETCIIQKKLRGMKDNPQVPLGTCKRYPMLYAEEDIPDSELEQHHQEMHLYFPPASNSEYHILKFYSFSSTLVSHVLQNIDTKVDFPFRVTDLEHAIINIKSKAPILLLGRSGTGKTTCCLYRLWSQFHAYWLKAKEANAPLLPRCGELVDRKIEDINAEDELEVSEEDIHREDAENNEGVVEDTSGGAAARCETGEMEMAAGLDDVYDHLHQLFITKNGVLSSEVQKNFRELSHADGSMREHVQHEVELLPSRLQDVRDYHYPLFLTSRQLLFMLDASLGPPYFFKRKEDGSLKMDIAGWTDLDGPLNNLLLLLDEDSDAEDDVEQHIEDDKEDEMYGHGQTDAGKKLKVDPRREITYGVFVEEIWPRFKKKMVGYHPSLVWMEIMSFIKVMHFMSFIKGSFEALSKPAGHLNKEEYIKLGRKRAQNFSGERDTIYQFFLCYEHFKKQNSLFDETDIVHSLFLRLCNQESRTWVIHQIFVDETQDFTQAELCLLIRLCQNPNDMFLTGDTAQGIMRGISFRFSDLRSLFYHAKLSMHAMGKTSSVEVPKQVYQLTHNYRSHSGIISLATSVLELIAEFFPESFDRLQPDQGLFHGPQPVLLESCSFSDLVILLRGNRRKTSHIDFGAHQAILVVNDAARDSIPEELRLGGLVLTIYEAKGLEFDDVLLYNFFKDSQASQEWRVVTGFLERLAGNQKGGGQNRENLVEIDLDVLAAEERPRPLNFDANQHKVLNSELKQLYTALTRARVNVWVFDQDMEKRAPMFEYFKARKLVKSMQVKEINETNLLETVFADKSSPADWLDRGEDFMKHSLYGLAEKCFGIGGDQERVKIAQAHNQALKASKYYHRWMKEEFIHAAELFLECNRPAKAALCLQNAKERELAAGLFEKLGQYERAAEIYCRLKQPMASSRCYEQLGNFDKAIEVLYDNEHFDFAIDTLRRYHLLINELKQKGSPIPKQLLANEPRSSYTEENLSHSAAELFHKYKNENRMLEAVDRFEKTDDKVGFLTKYKYIEQAAGILEQDGQLEKAAHLLLMYGRFDEAISMARKNRKEEVIARCLLVSCRAMMADHNREQHKELLEERLKEAFRMLKSCDDHDQAGQVLLLQAELSGKLDSIEVAWKAFLSLKPFPNEAGLIECCEWLIQNTKLKENETILQTTVRGVEHLFGVCNALLEPNTQTNMGKVLKYYQLYGLAPYSQDKLEVCPKEHPLCMKMIQELFSSESDTETLYVEKSKAHESMVVFLLKRCQPWLKIIGDALKLKRNSVKVCDFFQAGLDCPNFGKVDTSCSMRHEVQTTKYFLQLIETDLMMIEFESNVLEGASILKNRSKDKVREVLEAYLLNESNNPSYKYESCVNLWDDLLPLAGHPVFINEDSKKMVQFLRSKDKVLLHFKKYLQEKWHQFTAGNKKLECSAVLETECYLLMEFAYNLFGFNIGRRKLEKSPTQQILNLETQLDNEVVEKGAAIKKHEHYYTLMMTYDVNNRGKIAVTCVAHRFLDAYSFISRNFPDPFEAIIQFSKFQIQLSKRKSNINFYPDLKHYLTWLEFFSCIAILLLTKLKTKTFHDFIFFLPSHYMGLIRFIQATFPGQSHTVFDAVAWWEPPFKQELKKEELVAERLKCFALVISGHAQGIKIIDKIVDSCGEDPCNYALLERLIIMNMFLVCNIGKAVLVECEKSLMTSVCHLILPSKAPKRLEHTLQEIKKCKGIEDVARTLITLLKDRNMDEQLLVCTWRNDNRNVDAKPVQLEEESSSPFSTSFLNETTLQAMHVHMHALLEQTSVVEQHEEDDVTQEEIDKGMRDKELQMKADNESKAAKTIQHWFKQRLHCRQKIDEGLAEQEKTNIDKMLEAIKVDEKMCGICGLNFENKLEDLLNYRHNNLQYNSFERQSSIEANQSACDSVPENQLDSTDRCTLLLRDIKTKHELYDSHIQQSKEFESFKNRYKAIIRPKLYEINNFIKQSFLTDKTFVKENYQLEEMAILRMVSKCSSLEKNLQMAIANRQWPTECGKIIQQLKEIETDYKGARPCVEKVLIQIKEKEADLAAKQVPASSSTLAMQGETSDDELDDFKQVVAMPGTFKSIMMDFHKMRTKRRRKPHGMNEEN